MRFRTDRPTDRSDALSRPMMLESDSLIIIYTAFATSQTTSISNQPFFCYSDRPYAARERHANNNTQWLKWVGTQGNAVPGPQKMDVSVPGPRAPYFPGPGERASYCDPLSNVRIFWVVFMRRGRISAMSVSLAVSTSGHRGPSLACKGPQVFQQFLGP